MFKPNQKIGSYTLVKKLGRGGFGEVWLADSYGRYVTTQVAVKLPLDEQVDHALIEQEAGLWARASGHTNVLPIIEANEYDGQIVIVSEYAPDGSLEQLLKNNGGKLPVKQAVEMTIGILNGLEFLHSRNIIHRDLKPANVLLQGETPRLADFGISRALQTTVASQTQNISGTFAYMSPEALDGKRSVQTDIWAVGANLYRFLTCKLPFPQKEPSALFPAIIMRDYEKLPADIPQSLKTVIAKSLAKLPENRYQTAVEMREDLQKIKRGENVSASVQTTFDKPIPDSAIPPTEKVTIDSARNFQPETETVVRPVLTFGENEKRKSSSFWIFATIGLFLISVVGLVLYFASNQSSQGNLTKDNIIQSNNNTSIDNSSTGLVSTNSNTNSENVIANDINSNIKLTSNVTIDDININTTTTTPKPISTLDKTQLQKVINRYLAGVTKTVEAAAPTKEFRESREVAYGDLDNDGDEDVAVSFTIGFKDGGNWNVVNLAVFKNEGGKFKAITDTQIGGFFDGYANLKYIKNGKIYVENNGLVSYKLSGNKLIRGK